LQNVCGIRGLCRAGQLKDEYGRKDETERF
jgi:hypothetical protein